MKLKLYIVILYLFSLLSCERWEETADVSHVSLLPEWIIPGGEYISVARGDNTFTYPNVIATVDGKTVDVYYLGIEDVDLNTPGVYLITYYAENNEGLSSIKHVYVAVRIENIKGNDLSGNYVSNTFGLVESEVTKINDQGYYACEDVLGFPGAEMEGIFVDIGDNTLVLLNGEGYFGKYGVDEGSYSGNTLSWSVRLLDEPYTGLEIPVLWVKQ